MKLKGILLLLIFTTNYCYADTWSFNIALNGLGYGVSTSDNNEENQVTQTTTNTIKKEEHK